MKRPQEFVSLKELSPRLHIYVSYGRTDNFTGEIVAGYKKCNAYMVRIAAQALHLAQMRASQKGLALKIFDGYRPVKAVSFFHEWAKKPEANPHLKELYYPRFNKLQLFEEGYLALKSSHSRGSAVDLTLVEAATGQELDMGTRFDFFDDLSHTDSPRISQKQKENRMLLKGFMEEQGFKNYSQEWWHYNFKPEPFPDQYFDFDVE
jgi:D-alanyl-D-alanine dipeptidase